MSEILALQLIGIIAFGIILGFWGVALSFIIIETIVNPNVKIKRPWGN